MALSKRSTDLVIATYKELFNEMHPDYRDRKQDGGYEAITTYQDRVDNRDLEKLVAVSKEIGNSFVIVPHDKEKVRVTFF